MQKKKKEAIANNIKNKYFCPSTNLPFIKVKLAIFVTGQSQALAAAFAVPNLSKCRRTLLSSIQASPL